MPLYQRNISQKLQDAEAKVKELSHENRLLKEQNSRFKSDLKAERDKNQKAPVTGG